jgi:hypothetical protein
MTIDTILIVIGVVLLFLTYRKLTSLGEFFDVKNTNSEDSEKERDQESINFRNWLWEKLETIEKKLGELSDVATIANPAWGENSAFSLKNENLIKLYSQYLVEKEKLSQKDALIKARFVVNNFESGVIDDISRDIRFRAEVKSEEEVLLSDFFKKEVREEITTLKARDIFEPLWFGIKIKKYKKGDELLQNTRKAFEALSGQCGYQNYVEDSAIISKLVHLGIFEAKMENNEVRKTMSGHPFYILKEDDLEKLRKIIFAEDEENSEYYNDTYFEGRHSEDERIKLPFKKLFEVDS